MPWILRCETKDVNCCAPHQPPTDAAPHRRARAARARRARAVRPGSAACRRVGGAAQQADVAGGKGVGLAHGAQRDVLRRPLADAPDRAQPRHGLLHVPSGWNRCGIGERRLGQRRQRRLARIRHARARRDPRLRPAPASGRHGSAPRERAAPRSKGLPHRRTSCPASCRAAATRHLLPEDGAHRELEAVPAAGRAQARAARRPAARGAGRARGARRSSSTSAPRSNTRRTRARRRAAPHDREADRDAQARPAPARAAPRPCRARRRAATVRR